MYYISTYTLSKKLHHWKIINTSSYFFGDINANLPLVIVVWLRKEQGHKLNDFRWMDETRCKCAPVPRLVFYAIEEVANSDKFW